MAQVTFNAESQFVGHLSVMYLFSHGMIVNQQGGFELENSDSIFPMKIREFLIVLSLLDHIVDNVISVILIYLVLHEISTKSF